MRSVDDEKVKQQTKILVKTENRRWIAETLDCQQNSKGKKKSNLYGKRHRHFTAAIALTRMKALPLCMPLITNSNIDKPSRREIKKKKNNNNRRTSTETYMCIKKKVHIYIIRFIEINPWAMCGNGFGCVWKPIISRFKRWYIDVDLIKVKIYGFRRVTGALSASIH